VKFSYTLSCHQKKPILPSSYSSEKKSLLLIDAFQSVIQFPRRFLADLISSSDGPISTMTRLINVVKYICAALCIESAWSSDIYIASWRYRIYSWSHLPCVMWFFYLFESENRSRKQEKERERERETKGLKGKSMGICYPRYCFTRSVEGGSFRYGNKLNINCKIYVNGK